MQIFLGHINKAWFCFLFLGLWASNPAIYAQTTGPQRNLIIAPNTDTLQLDSNTVLPTSLSLVNSKGEALPDSCFQWINNYKNIVFLCTIDEPLYAQFQVLPNDLSQPVFLRDVEIYERGRLQKQAVELAKPKQETQSWVPFDGLTRSGSLSRSVRVGSNQDAVLNSSLDLQLSGKIGEKTTINASITDNTVPIQADGFSQQLREFDRVYIEIENEDAGTVRAGDYNINNHDHYFLAFDKRITGGGIDTRIKLGEGKKLDISANAALARGIFARNSFQGREGDQGPYKLFGNNNELFIIIISGSERVYIDGRLLKRGQDFDYVIDYNAGELTFTTLQPITKDRRIVIEFQYTAQNYLRSITYNRAKYATPKFTIDAAIYSEQDSKTQLLFQDLSDEQKGVLAQAGDNPELAQSEAIIPVDFDPSLILYRRVDTLGETGVLVFSTDSTQQLFRANFSFVGPGKGDYELAQSNANGRVFRFVPRVNGVSQGSYAPINRLIAPQLQQIISLKSAYDAGKAGVFSVQLGYSRNDLNRYSDLDSDDDLGIGVRLGHELEREWRKWRVKSDFFAEYVSAHFQTVERLRQVEFDRDWALAQPIISDQVLGGWRMAARSDSVGELALSSQFFQNAAYQGFKQGLEADINAKGWRVQGFSSYLKSEALGSDIDFFRQKSLIAKKLYKQFYTGIRSEAEVNLNRDEAGNFFAGSYQFLEYDAFLGWGDSTKRYVELFYTQRLDDTAFTEGLQQAARATGWGVRSKIRLKPSGVLHVQLLQRDLQVFLPVEQEVVRTYTGQARYNQRLAKGFITLTSFVEAGTGAEPRRAFSFIEVPPGTGTHTWIDYNNNGIQELDEFEIARFPAEATFIRVFTPTNEFVRTTVNRFSQMLLLQPAALLKPKATGWKKFAGRWSFQGTLQTDRRNLLTGNSNSLNPFQRPISDTSLIAQSDSWRSSLFFNRSNLKFGGDITLLENTSKNLLGFGLQEIASQEQQLNLRYQIIKPLVTRASVKLGERSSFLENLSSRDFRIQYFGSLHSLSFQPKSSFTSTLSFEWNRKNSMASDEDLLLQRLSLESNYNVASKTSLTGTLAWIGNAFEGNPNTPLAFEMLEGFRPGSNVQILLTLQRTLGNGLQVNISYEGRVSQDIPTIHSGFMQVKAFF